MGKSVVGALFVPALLCMAILLSCVAAGQMLPIGLGFPNAVQTSTTTAWQQDNANAFNFEDASIVPVPGCVFPAIHQTSVNVQSMSHTEFSQTTEFAAIGYPCVSMGPGPFGGFACGI